MHKLALSLVLVCLSFLAVGQKNARPGYIITLHQDTLHGQVQDLSDARNSLSVSFMAATGGNWREYKAEDLKGFGVTGQKKYVAEKVVRVTQRSVTDIDSTWHVVFLQELVKGPISLYYLKTASAPDRFFLMRAGGRFTEIEKRRQLFKVGNGTYLKTFNLYQDSLKTIFASCPELAAKASKTQYSVKHLSKAFIAYNACAYPAEQTFVSEIATRKTVVMPSVTVGYASNTMKISEKGERFFSEPEGTSHMSGGLAVNIFHASVSKKFSLQVGADYSRKGATATYTVRSSGIGRQAPTSIDLECLDFSVLIKYNLRLGVVRPFIGVGPLAGYILNNGKTYKQDTYYLDSPSDNAEYGIAAETGFWLPVFPKHGLLFSLRYEGTRISYNITNRGEYFNHFIRLGVGYWFSSSGK